jgi:ABC-type phosphate transport system permease subunit
MIQHDLELAFEQLDGIPSVTLGLYAYAAIKLLEKRKPEDVKNGSLEIEITDVPVYSQEIQHEVPMNLNAKITVLETLE